MERSDAMGSIEAMAARCSNWGRWGEDDVLGTLNFVDDAKRVEAAGLVRTGRTFSLAQAFDTNGPQNGWRRRTNPVHTMTDTGTEAEFGDQGFPHGFGGADDVIAMPLQCSTQWDGLGHIFDRGRASARPTSSSTPRLTTCAAAVSMPVTWSPSEVTTEPARRPFQARPRSKM